LHLYTSKKSQCSVNSEFASQSRDALLLQIHIPCRQNHPEDIPKNKTQHYSGITFMSRERLLRARAALFTIPGKFLSEFGTKRTKLRQNKTARRPF